MCYSIYTCCEREDSAGSIVQRVEVSGCEPPAVRALGSPRSTGQSPACGARYCSLSAAQRAEHGWYRGSHAFVPVGTEAYFFALF